MPSEFDAIIIGGGITGAGVLRDISLRGFKALLIEKGRPAHGTTVNSSHLIHGGLRYLLYDRLTTHATCWDSGHIVRIARPLLTRLPILWPVYAGHRHSLSTVETLLESYDGFQRMKYGLPHLRLSAAAARRLVPGLKPEGLRGALAFDEWWVDPEALVEANLAAARRRGAEVRIGTAAVGLLREGAAVSGVHIEKDGRTETVRSRLVINAGGPWVDRVAALASLQIPLRLRKGTHLLYEGFPPALGSLTRPMGLLLEAVDRDRYVFVVPGGGMTLVGPTDVATREDPDRLSPGRDEVRYLLDSMRRYFPDFPERFDRAIVGARPILGQGGAEKLLSREFEVFDHSARDGVPGFLTVAGGKMSDFRLMGEDAGDSVARLLGRPAACLSHRETLDGRPVGEIPHFPRPWAPLKRFLRRHPRLREFHAYGHLAAAFGRHLIRNACGRRHAAGEDDFLRHYADRADVS